MPPGHPAAFSLSLSGTRSISGGMAAMSARVLALGSRVFIASADQRARRAIIAVLSTISGKRPLGSSAAIVWRTATS